MENLVVYAVLIVLALSVMFLQLQLTQLIKLQKSVTHLQTQLTQLINLQKGAARDLGYLRQVHAEQTQETLSSKDVTPTYDKRSA